MATHFELLRSDVIARPAFARVALRVSGFRLPLSLEHITPRNAAFDVDDRAELIASIEPRLRELEPHVAVRDSLAQLARSDALCVVTGQQPGLLGGPLYSLYKALHAVRLARSLSQAWERPVVPLFWNHADDHDVAEVHHAWLLNENLDLQRLGLAGLSSGKHPVSRVRFDAEKQRLGALGEALAQSLARWPGAKQAIPRFMPRDGDTFATAFTRTLTDLLGHLGLLVVEPDWIRMPASRALARVVQAPLPAAFQRGEQALRELGVEPQIPAEGAALLYHVDAHGRHALRLGGDGFRYDGEEGSRTPSELAAQIVQSPYEWSPGALLRPLVQDSILPSVAYVGGWGELQYLAQLPPVREVTGTPHTAAVPRWSCTLVEDEAAEALEQLGTSLSELISTRGSKLSAGDDEPAPAVVLELRRIAEEAARALTAQREQLAELDRGLAANLPRTGAQIRSLVDKMCEKAERVHDNRRGRGRRLVRRATNTLVPRGELQERVLGALPFVARHGTAWIDELFEAMAPLETGHLAVRIQEPKEQTP